MPTYDYRCEKCDHEFDVFQSITAAPLKKCPKCKKAKLRRLIGTGAALLFKGDGFYITDYRSESYKNAAKADSGSTGSDTKPADGKSADAKPTDGKSADAKPAESKPADPAAPKEAKSESRTEHKSSKRSRKH